MPSQDKPTPERHYFELPPGIDKMTDEEISTLAAELVETISSVMPAARSKDEKDAEKTGLLQRVQPDSTLTIRFLEEPTEWIQFFEYFDKNAGENGMFLPQAEGVRLSKHQKPIVRYLVNALDIENSKVIPLVLSKTSVDQLIHKYQDYSTILDRNYAITREGTGFDTDYYVDQQEPESLDLSNYSKFDLVEALERQLAIGLEGKHLASNVLSDQEGEQKR